MPRDELRNVLELVNGWLRFAETKNGVLMALNISAAAAGQDLAENVDSSTIMLVRYAFAVLMLTSACVCLRSFFPRLTKPVLLGKWTRADDGSNPLYFGSIARMTAKIYEDRISSLLNAGEPLDQWDRAYVDQIKTNSSIAFAKYRLFMLASAFTAVGLLLFSVLLIASM